ncbi:type I-B CRISPR-associated protein Cas5b [Caldicellulosiruptor morganii]|uniref:Type I-B CRISPR-associated protein Cas5b n=1 Tax=Caldicellulosiruptor morganii TaxID=1387555 RepID=A0ABY7BNA1_9FIRM|nr:type I-B CRISPR-associated protein Cas5b [Caldicellulosiruptor morganii]WAM33898.1 type I-B CRISPR-associated protein Cas5b [Caldicellulosiruptor morganii]
MKVAVFDIKADFGFFGKFYSTSSPITYPFPPFPTIQGMVGAILGLDKKEYLEALEHGKFAAGIRILNPVKKIRMGINHIDTKYNRWQPIKTKDRQPRTQMRFELLKDPCFRIYVTFEQQGMFSKLVDFLQQHKSFFTLSMGLSEFIADFEFTGVYEAFEKHMPADYVNICTPISPKNLQETDAPIKIEEGKSYFKERMPLIMNSSREVIEYEDFIFEPSGKEILAKPLKFLEVENGENIVLF